MHLKGPEVKRLEQRMMAEKCNFHELYARSTHLVTAQSSLAQKEEQRASDEERTEEKIARGFCVWALHRVGNWVSDSRTL